MELIRLPCGIWWYDPKTPLGEPGGFGAVFVGGHEENDSSLAVKRLFIDAETAGHRELEIAETLVGQELDYVVPILDSGQDAESDQYFVIMERADGDLREVLDSGPVGQEVAVATAKDIVAGLIEVGDLVHRDLKPGNVLHHEDRWKLADFGIARFVEESTSLNTLKGFLSAAYAAPEQWQMQRATHATDVYALGCILFELIVGETPFLGSREELGDQHVSAIPPALPQADPSLARLVAMMLRKSPEARPSLTRIDEVLQRIQDAQGTEEPRAGVSAFRRAAVEVEREEAEREAEAVRVEAGKTARQALQTEALLTLEAIRDELFSIVEEEAGSVTRSSEAISYGKGKLTFAINEQVVPSEAFPHSGWDVVANAIIEAAQESEQYGGRSATLWYTNLGTDTGYRWYEVPYMRLRHQVLPLNNPIAVTDFDQTDAAASSASAIHAHAAEPRPIDDEDMTEFIDRWLGWFGNAAKNSLERPGHLPE